MHSDDPFYYSCSASPLTTAWFNLKISIAVCTVRSNKNPYFVPAMAHYIPSSFSNGDASVSPSCRFSVQLGWKTALPKCPLKNGVSFIHNVFILHVVYHNLRFWPDSQLKLDEEDRLYTSQFNNDKLIEYFRLHTEKKKTNWIFSIRTIWSMCSAHFDRVVFGCTVCAQTDTDHLGQPERLPFYYYPLTLSSSSSSSFLVQIKLKIWPQLWQWQRVRTKRYDYIIYICCMICCYIRRGFWIWHIASKDMDITDDAQIRYSDRIKHLFINRRRKRMDAEARTAHTDT